MSFSDFSSSKRAVATQQQTVPSAPLSGNLSGRADVLSQISDVLLQYQVRLCVSSGTV